MASRRAVPARAAASAIIGEPLRLWRRPALGSAEAGGAATWRGTVCAVQRGGGPADASTAAAAAAGGARAKARAAAGGGAGVRVPAPGPAQAVPARGARGPAEAARLGRLRVLGRLQGALQHGRLVPRRQRGRAEAQAAVVAVVAVRIVAAVVAAAVRIVPETTAASAAATTAPAAAAVASTAAAHCARGASAAQAWSRRTVPLRKQLLR